MNLTEKEIRKLADQAQKQKTPHVMRGHRVTVTKIEVRKNDGETQRWTPRHSAAR